MPTPNDKNMEQTPVTKAFLEHHGFLSKFVARFLPRQHDVEDVVQEAYLRAYVAEQKKEIDQPKAFLFRVAKNTALTKLTKKSRQITDYLEESASLAVIGTEPSAEKELEAQESLGLYCEAIAKLSDKCREVFLLRKVHGLSHKEIASRMSLSISSVEKYLRQGILACKSHINDAEGHSLGAKVSSAIHGEFRNQEK